MADERDEKPQRDPETGRMLPGHSGLPGAGRPKGRKSLTDALWRILGRTPSPEELDRLFNELAIPPDLREAIRESEDRQAMFAEILVHRALTGHAFCIQEVWDRLDPKRKEISGPGGSPIRAEALAVVGEMSDEQAAETYRSMVGGAEVVDDGDGS